MPIASDNIYSFQSPALPSQLPFQPLPESFIPTHHSFPPCTLKQMLIFHSKCIDKQPVKQTRRLSFLENPLTKQFIAEVTAYSTVYKKPNEGYDNVLRVMQQYFTVMNPSHTLFDGTSIQPKVFSSNNELRANRKITGFLYENDITLTLQQINTIYADTQIIQNRMRSKRKITSNKTLRWTDGIIPYVFGISDEKWQNEIKKSMQYLEKETCIRFLERTTTHNDFIVFIRGSGCYSGIGKVGGSQTISIGYGCETLGIIIHEIGHSLGFWHEQERPERDYYVRINLSHVLSGTEGNFAKRSRLEIIDLGVPYDLGSIMHYASNTFAKSPYQLTIDPWDVKFRSTIGNRVSPSFTDVKQINQLYCTQRCERRLPCKHGGYPDPNGCQRCKCPEGLGGQYCDTLQYSRCGRELIATEIWQILKYSGNETCFWRISTKDSNKIRFEVFEVFFKCDPTCEEFVEVKHNSDMQLIGFRLCCLPYSGKILSHNSFIIVISKALLKSTFSLRYISGTFFLQFTKITTQILNPNSFLTKLNPCSQTSNPILINWGKWGACTEKCGACGVQYRYLMQNGKQISSPKFGSPQSKICNTQPCESSGVLKSRSDLYVTNGRLKKFFIFFLIDFWTFLFFN
ncbi:unnamed protein product [Dracunculus medinensis]|uniref:Metalloendopeptidase n=1 Tax=Dracunculus medinensis TaxID=318479 RepID=A0A158Q559_DRAME|nr:unnamed protein product [Dracunculus medinensis]